MKRQTSVWILLLLAVSLLAGCTKPPAAPTKPSVQVQTEAPTEFSEVSAEPIQLETTEPSTFVPVIRPVTTGEQKQVTVSTVDEFLAAIAPDTEILLNTDLLDLSQAAGYGKTNGEYYSWEAAYDGPELQIANLTNLTIRGTGENHGATVISSDPRYAYVLTFVNCGNVHLAGFTAGHSKEPGTCLGGVVAFRNSQDILVEDCGLFGCGTLGVMGDSCKNMQIVNNEIYECSVGGVEFSNCDDVNVDGNTFRDLGGDIFRVYGCGTVTCNGEAVWDFSPRNR